MSNKKRNVICIFLAIILLFVNVSMVTAATKSKSELQNEKNEKQKEIDAAKKELKEIESKMTETERQLNNLNSQIGEYEDQISDLTVQINDNEQKLAKAQEDYTKQHDQFNDRIVALYEAGQTTYLDILLSSSDISEFISSYYVIEEMAEMDNQLLDDLENTKNEISETKASLEQNKAQVEQKSNELKTRKAERTAYINKLTDEQKTVQKQKEDYEKEMKDIEAEIRKMDTSDFNYNGGQMAWPTPGYYKITSRYGYRVHPIYHDWRLHTGVDLGAPRGANFVAAEAGVVKKAGWNGGYGNCVIISHGNNVSTLYGHGTSILVSVGQKVSKGQPVMTIGSTGNSTGPHAHFEVRKYGSTVDPLPYITGK